MPAIQCRNSRRIPTPNLLIKLQLGPIGTISCKKVPSGSLSWAELAVVLGRCKKVFRAPQISWKPGVFFYSRPIALAIRVLVGFIVSRTACASHTRPLPPNCITSKKYIKVIRFLTFSFLMISTSQYNTRSSTTFAFPR